SLVIGAMLGGAFGATADLLFPMLAQDPRAYVLVGMAGFFAGVANAPIATLIMVSELTGNYGLLAPLMLVSVVAMVALRRTTIYEKQVPGRIDSPAHLGDFVVDVLEGISVADLEAHGREPILIPEGMPLSEVIRQIAATEAVYYPVVDGSGVMRGILSVNDIRRIFDEDIPPGLVIARDVAVTDVVTARPDEPLNQTLRKLTGRDLEEIPVMDLAHPGRVRFMLSRRAVLARYATELEEKRGVYADR
ncbi:MAG TPA: chloride channel protein, partial [Deferrisomatales bacterium]|nr:chloride channel protein [Deferrisomatales bacterium]